MATDDIARALAIKAIQGGGGGTTVVANPTLAGTEADLTGLQVGDTKYAIPAGGAALHYDIALTNQQYADLEANGTVTVTDLNIPVNDIKAAVFGGDSRFYSDNS